MIEKFCTRLPSPKTPAKIKIASLMAQIRQMIKIFSLLMPCFSTNAFCAPIAKMSDKEVKNPDINACNLSFSLKFCLNLAKFNFIITINLCLFL